MTRRILIVNGHPDPRPERFCAALCDAYAAGALEAAHEVRRLDVGALDFPLIRTAAEFEQEAPGPDIRAAQKLIAWANHLVLAHPLWMGSSPALLKAFFEQSFRYGFALGKPGDGVMRGLLAGRSARLVVTMGMPAPVYRFVFGAVGVRSEETGILMMAGIGPVRRTLIGGLDAAGGPRAGDLEHMRRLGRQGL
jgi:putative NADPH-quinone reductase